MAVGNRKKALATVLFLAVVLGFVGSDANAQQAREQFKYGRFLEAKASEFAGKALYPDGKSPASGLAVRVWSVEKKKFVAKAVTAKDGTYKLGKLAAGRYLVVYGDRVTVELRVTDKAEVGIETLDVIIPRGESVFAQMAQERRETVLTLMGAAEPTEGASGADGSGLVKTLLIGTGATATAVAVLERHNDDNDGDGPRKVESP